MQLVTYAQKIGVSERGLAQLLRCLGSEKLSFSEVSKRSGLSIETVKKTKIEASAFFLPINNFFVLSKVGIEELEKYSTTLKEFRKDFETDILSFYTDLQDIRPMAERKYDQFYSTPETQVKRIKLFAEDLFLEETSFLFLGDDDLTSVSLALTRLCNKITVCDIDMRQLALIENISKKRNLEINVHHTDLKKPLPDSLKNNFQAVFTDPPYTEDGFRLFLSKAVEALKKIGGKIYICYGASDRSPEKYLPIQAIISEYGLVIEQIYKAFNSYSEAESIGSRSSLYVLKSTASTKVAKKAESLRIYTYE